MFIQGRKQCGVKGFVLFLKWKKYFKNAFVLFRCIKPFSCFIRNHGAHKYFRRFHFCAGVIDDHDAH